MAQIKQREWHEQWSLMQDGEKFLFNDWIFPARLEDFKDKEVLECGCGGGQHTSFMAPYAKTIDAVDLNTTDIAKKRNKDFSNVVFVEADIATMELGKQYDIVICIGVLQHTDSPERTLENMKKHLKPGGQLIIWAYSLEGNWLAKHVVEAGRRKFLTGLSRKKLLLLSKFITALMYPFVYSIYLLPLKFLPYYEYFCNFRKLSFYRNTLNVFDKLNAPQTDFISRARAIKMLEGLDKVQVLPYKGVSWRMNGFKLGKHLV